MPPALIPLLTAICGLFRRLRSFSISSFVAIGINPDKDYTFSLEERLGLLCETTSQFDNVTVSSYENQFLVNYARGIGAGYIVRGIRTQSDYEY